MSILNSDDLNLAIASGAITPSQDIYAGALYDVRLTGVTFIEGRAYRLTAKPKTGWDSPSFTITVDDFTFDAGDLTGELNLNNPGLITYCRSRSNDIVIEIWDDTQGRPVAKSFLTCYAPVNRVSDTASQTQPRSYTNAQIDTLDDSHQAAAESAAAAALSSHAGTANPHSGSAASGANSDITSLAGLTTPLSMAQGGSGSATPAALHDWRGPQNIFENLRSPNDETVIFKRASADRYDAYVHMGHNLYYAGYRLSREESTFDPTYAAHANGRPFQYSTCKRFSNYIERVSYKDGVTFVGTWSNNGSYKYSTTAGDYAEYEFYGNRVSLFLRRVADVGIVSITIDGQAALCDAITLTGDEALKDMYVDADEFAVANNLRDGWHTIRVTVTGSKNVASTDDAVYWYACKSRQRVFSENAYDTTLTLTDDSVTLKAAGVVDELAISVGGYWSGSWHGNTRPSVAGAHTVYVDGVATEMAVGDVVMARRIMLEQSLVHYVAGGDDFATNTMQHVITRNGLEIRNDFTLTADTTIAAFYPMMGDLPAADYVRLPGADRTALAADGSYPVIGSVPFTSIAADDSKGILFLFAPLRAEEWMLHPYIPHFYRDNATGIKWYYAAQKDAQLTGWNVKSAALYAYTYCETPSSLM